MLLLFGLTILYFLSVGLILLFFAGAAKLNERWDEADRVWAHSQHDRKNAA